MTLRHFLGLFIGSFIFTSMALPAWADVPVEGASEAVVEKVPVRGAVKIAKVYFISPKDGDTVQREFTAKFGVEGLKVAKAGEIVPGTGHFHILIDVPAVAEGLVVPADAKHLHYGQGQTEAKLKLSPGEHTLILQFADGAHRAYNKMLTQEIKVRVK